MKAINHLERLKNVRHLWETKNFEQAYNTFINVCIHVLYISINSPIDVAIFIKWRFSVVKNCQMYVSKLGFGVACAEILNNMKKSILLRQKKLYLFE